jgi:site-specific recombinase XerD
LTPESRFYLSIGPRYHNKTAVDVENTNIWFTLNPLGKSKLGDLVRTMAEKAALDGRKVNHSARKTTVTSLLHSNIEATTVKQLTGHTNMASITKSENTNVTHFIGHRLRGQY